jgi:predicted ATPase
VLEKQITFEHLCAIANITDDLALPALDELISGRLLIEATQRGAASAYTFTNDMLRDVVYTEAGDARRRLFHQRSMEVLEAAGDSAAVLAHHALAAGLAQAAFRHSLAAGREALRISAVSESIVHFERARQFVQEAALPDIPNEVDLRDLYMQLSQAYQLGGQTEKALAMDAEFGRLG